MTSNDPSEGSFKDYQSEPVPRSKAAGYLDLLSAEPDIPSLVKETPKGKDDIDTLESMVDSLKSHKDKKAPAPSEENINVSSSSTTSYSGSEAKENISEINISREESLADIKESTASLTSILKHEPSQHSEHEFSESEAKSEVDVAEELHHPPAEAKDLGPESLIEPLFQHCKASTNVSGAYLVKINSIPMVESIRKISANQHTCDYHSPQEYGNLTKCNCSKCAQGVFHSETESAGNRRCLQARQEDESSRRHRHYRKESSGLRAKRHVRDFGECPTTDHMPGERGHQHKKRRVTSTTMDWLLNQPRRHGPPSDFPEDGECNPCWEREHRKRDLGPPYVVPTIHNHPKPTPIRKRGTKYCPRCGIPVYWFHEKKVGNNSFHPGCFTCASPTCGKQLCKKNFMVVKEEIFCKVCGPYQEELLESLKPTPAKRPFTSTALPAFLAPSH